ncbi:MAG: HepT-like ribonuclease domain-containing protein [Candidatus Hydrogenedentota bacterium]
MSRLDNKLIEKLKEYFYGREDVIMAFIFGSYATNQVHSESDMDIAVYFKPESSRMVEIETAKQYQNEDEIWASVEKISGINTDLVVLNRARSTLSFNILKKGLPLSIKDRDTYLKFYLAVSAEAEEFRGFVKDYWEIYQRSRSLSDTDKTRLMEILHFMDTEIKEFPLYKEMDFKKFKNDKFFRRNVERWTETLTMALMDTAKIIMSSSNQEMPETYYNCLLEFGMFIKLSEDETRRLAGYAKLRNILVHEYLDIRFGRIREFIDTAYPLYVAVIDKVKKMIE